MQEPRQVGHVARGEHVVFLGRQGLHEHLGVVVRSQASGSGERGEWVQHAPAGLRRLTRAELAAVPHDRGPGAVRGERFGHALGLREAEGRQGPQMIDLRRKGVGMMDQEETHRLILPAPPGRPRPFGPNRPTHCRPI